MVTIHDNGYTEFRFFRPGAHNVFLAGDFNEWRADQLRMIHQGDGHWSIKLALPAGAYKFRYVADGHWYTDFAGFGVEPGRFGYDSLILVPQRKLSLSRRQQAAGGQAAAAA